MAARRIAPVVAIVLILFSMSAFCQNPPQPSDGDVIERLMPDGNPRKIIIPKPADQESAVRQLRKIRTQEQGSRAQQAAFLLAVLNVDYEKNRDYLLWVLRGCKVPSVTRGCDEMTPEYLAYLSNHGHEEILTPLMRDGVDSYSAAGSESFGSFLSEVVTDEPDRFLDALLPLPAPTQKRVCLAAGESDGSGMSPADLKRVNNRLGAMTDPVARRCLSEIEKANEPE